MLRSLDRWRGEADASAERHDDGLAGDIQGCSMARSWVDDQPKAIRGRGAGSSLPCRRCDCRRSGRLC